MKKYIFEDVPLSVPQDKDEIKKVFAEMLSSNNQAVISFINPEIFLMQEKDKNLHEYFKNAKYNFIDGINLLYAINKKLGTDYSFQNRFPGTDFFEYLPEDRKVKIYLYGSKIENLEDAKIKLESKYPNIKIVEWTYGYTKFSGDFLISKINEKNPDILIVCKGCPLQEKWISENKDKLNAKIIFGNGGAVDFWSGNTKRAPDFMIHLGLEWLFRLFASFSVKRVLRQMKLAKFLVNYKRGKYEIREESSVDSLQNRHCEQRETISETEGEHIV